MKPTEPTAPAAESAQRLTATPSAPIGGDAQRAATAEPGPLLEITRRQAASVTNPQALAEQYGIPYYEMLTPAMTTSEAIDKVPQTIAEQYGIVPLTYNPATETLVVAIANPTDLKLLDTIAARLDCSVSWVVAHAADIQACIQQAYKIAPAGIPAIADANQRPPQMPAEDRMQEMTLPEHDNPSLPDNVRIVDALLRAAFEERASDVSIEPQEGCVAVRLRIDGSYRPLEPPIEIGWSKSVISRIKVVADMDIAETRAPQDSSIRVHFRGIAYDVRVATSLSIYGETVTLRVLDPRNADRRLSDIDLSPPNLSSLQRLIAFPNGVILVTGKTGSGKTTTLLAIINELKDDAVKIMTIEDPVEYRIPGVIQAQVNLKTAFGFPQALSALLRQSPDIILIGEMRDTDTAQTALRAALTGHLVLSTLHTNDAASAVIALNKLDIPSHITASALRGVVSQTLARRLCQQCSQAGQPDAQIIERLGIKTKADLSNAHHAVGCRCCHQGYLGRVGLHEVLINDAAMQAAILAGCSAAELQKLACESTTARMFPLRFDGVVKAVQLGLTSLDEVLRVTLA